MYRPFLMQRKGRKHGHMVKRKSVKIEDMIHYRTLVFLVHKEDYGRAASVLVRLYNEWTAKDIHFDCGIWIEQRKRDIGIRCEYVRSEPWRNISKGVAI